MAVPQGQRMLKKIFFQLFSFIICFHLPYSEPRALIHGFVWSFSTLENYHCSRDVLQLEINFVPENNLLYVLVLVIRRERCV